MESYFAVKITLVILGIILSLVSIILLLVKFAQLPTNYSENIKKDSDGLSSGKANRHSAFDPNNMYNLGSPKLGGGSRVSRV